MFFHTSERIKNFKNRLKNLLLGRPWHVFPWNYILYHKVMGAQLLSNPARQEKEWVSSVKIIHLTLQSTWNCMLLQKISTTALKWLNSAHVARCQRPQRPPIKKAKTSSRAKCPYLTPTRFSFQSVALNCHSLSKNWELVLPPYEKNLLGWEKFSLLFSTVDPKYVK